MKPTPTDAVTLIQSLIATEQENLVVSQNNIDTFNAVLLIAQDGVDSDQAKIDSAVADVEAKYKTQFDTLNQKIIDLTNQLADATATQ